jgi:hypothetical protein
MLLNAKKTYIIIIRWRNLTLHILPSVIHHILKVLIKFNNYDQKKKIKN